MARQIPSYVTVLYTQFITRPVKYLLCNLYGNSYTTVHFHCDFTHEIIFKISNLITPPLNEQSTKLKKEKQILEEKEERERKEEEEKGVVIEFLS